MAASSSSPARPARTPSQLLAVPLLRIAVIVAAVGRMAMVAVMGMTPVALHHHGTGSPAVVSVISLHITGMWALSPFIRVALDRFGRRPGIVAAGAVSVAGCLLAATDAGAVPIAVGPVPDRAQLVGELPGCDRGDQRPHRTQPERAAASGSTTWW